MSVRLIKMLLFKHKFLDVKGAQNIKLQIILRQNNYAQ